MANKSGLRHRDIEPAHPGEFLEEIVIPATGKTKTEIADLLGVSRQTLYDVTKKKQVVTPNLALRLGKLFGDGPEVWLRMQMEHDLWAVRKANAAVIEKIPTLATA
ncbi:MAG TPA: HigA family addiction module antitoxin [Roseiarcus sp.]|nr:HigA family addiction module antitoxin [Roseiarcus sp.]